MKSFFCSHISSAHRLPNGNTLICQGPQGIVFEVTREGEEVWRYINPGAFRPVQTRQLGRGGARGPGGASGARVAMARGCGLLQPRPGEAVGAPHARERARVH